MSTTESSSEGSSAKASGAPGDVAQALKDAAHTVIGFGVMGWNKAQRQRRAWTKELNANRHSFENQLDGAREKLATAIRRFDARTAPVRNDIEVNLDKAAEHLPEQVRELVDSARKVVRDTEHQIRQAVGGL
jgi:DNA anti-recombination protein RmuC